MHHYKNLQENAILERIHQFIGSTLKKKDLVNVTFDAVAPWRKILTYIAYTVRCSYHSTLKSTPGQSVIGRDMLLDINFQPNYKDMWLRKTIIINNNNKREKHKASGIQLRGRPLRIHYKGSKLPQIRRGQIRSV